MMEQMMTDEESNMMATGRFAHLRNCYITAQQEIDRVS